MKNVQKTRNNFVCEICDYVTSKKSDLNKHNSTLKHINATNNAQKEILSDTQCIQNSLAYNCLCCNYNTQFKYIYNRHLLSEKHKRNVNGEPNEKKHICCICNKEYLNYKSLWTHKKKCIPVNNTGNLRFPRTPLPFFPF